MPKPMVVRMAVMSSLFFISNAALAARRGSGYWPC
jgi:hypothetical protein